MRASNRTLDLLAETSLEKEKKQLVKAKKRLD